MTALYEIVASYRADLDALAALDIDDPQTISDTIEGMGGELQDKLRAVIAYSLEVDILAKGAADAATRMAFRAASLEKRVKWLRQYAQDAMQVAGMGEIATDEWAAKLAKTPGKIVIQEGATIPLPYWRQPDPPAATVDKKALADAIKSGAEIPGVSLVTGFRLSIR